MYATREPDLVLRTHPALTLENVHVGKVALQLLVFLVVLGVVGHSTVAPLRLTTTYLHEVGHALAALFTGGVANAITVSPDEGGVATTDGGILGLILAAGYGFSALVGALALAASQRQSHSGLACVLIVGVALLGGVAFAMDRPTQQTAFLLAAGALVLGFLCWGQRSWKLGSLLLRFVGTFWVTWTAFDLYADAWASPVAAETAEVVNDAAALGQLIGFGPTVVATAGIFGIIAVGFAAAVWSVRIAPPRVQLRGGA